MNNQFGQNNQVNIKQVLATWKIIAISIIVGVLIGGGAYTAFQKFVKTDRNSVVSDESAAFTPVISSSTSSNTTSKQLTQLPVVNCGTSLNYQNFNCFNSAVKNCTLAKIISKDEGEIFGMFSKSAAVYEIKGRQGNECVFYLKVTDGSVSFTKEAVQQMLDSGMTNEEVAQQQQESNKAARSLVGREGSCKFYNAADLLKVFSNWKEGNFSTADFSGMDCWGEYFGTGGQKANVSKTVTMEDCVAQKGYAAAVTSVGTACFKNDIDLGIIVDSGTVNGKNPQCCALN
ncbi:MAG: hypothetical protein KBC69_04230 [Candidatus Magasanikbacteria bacterium]|nr:hypothetical protein [Candidatus Magasanikbacteria bacterium]